MKRFKMIDFWISALLVSTFFILTIIDTGFLLPGYFIVGGWQVVSMLVHTINRCFTYKKGIRNTYHWIVLVSLVTFPLGSFWVLLFIAPVMAIAYTYMCYYEIFKKMQRPLAQLK